VVNGGKQIESEKGKWKDGGDSTKSCDGGVFLGLM